MYLVRDMATRWSQHFHEHTQSMLGGGWLLYAFKKCLLWCIVFSYGIAKNQKKFKVLFGRETFYIEVS